MTKAERRPAEHVKAEARLHAAMARIMVEVQMSSVGQAMCEGKKTTELMAAARDAPKTGWVPIGHVVSLDSRGCIRRVKMRFIRWEDGEKREMFRMIRSMPDGTVEDLSCG